MYKILSGITLLIGILIGSLIYMMTSIVPDFTVYLPCIILSFFFILCGAWKEYKPEINNYIIVALILRFLIMLWNVYGRDVFCFPGVGTDTEGFFASASAISKNFTLIKGQVYGSYYAKYLGILYTNTGASYLLGSYLNYLYSVLAISFLNKTLLELPTICEADRQKALLLYAFMPNYMIIGSSLRRESLLIMFIMLSQYQIIRWAKTSHINYGLYALFSVLLGSAIHAGVIGIVTGYVVMLLFYDPISETWRFRRNAILTAVIIFAGAVLVFVRFRNVFLAKLLVSDEQTFYKRATRAVGGAAYLTSISISSFLDLVKYLPLKMFYFISSPVPWDWRGVSDIVAFVLDAIVYIVLIKYIAFGINKYKACPLMFSMDLSVICCLIIYAIGSQNSANAMRHRMKILGPMLIVMCLANACKTYKITEREAGT